MQLSERIRVRIGQTALPARRTGADEVVIEGLLKVDPGNVITVEGEDMVVVEAATQRAAPGPGGRAPRTRTIFRPVAAVV